MVPGVELPGDKKASAERLHERKANAIIEPNSKETRESGVQYVGKIKKSLYSCVTKDISTQDAVITHERIQHILQNHPEEKHAEVVKRLFNAIEDPDFILADEAPKTAVVLKSFSDLNERYRIVFRLHSSDDPPDYKNSVITAFYISEKKYKKYIRNKKALYKKE